MNGAVPPSDAWPPREGSVHGYEQALESTYGPAPAPGVWPSPRPPEGAWPGSDGSIRGAAGQGRSRRGGRGGIGGALAAAAAAVAKYGVILYKLKYVTVVASMLVSILAYGLVWGWAFAVGFVALLFVHESGHVLEMRRQGIAASAPMFVPFMGAVISMRGRAASAYEEARIGLAGPAFGVAASAVVAFVASYQDSDFLRALAFVGFFLNLINLFPALPLDGGRAVGALHPAVWLLGLVGLVGVELWRPSPLLLLIILLGAVELWRRWRGRNSFAARTYHDLRAGQRFAVGTVYAGLVTLCLIGMNATYLARTVH